MQALKNRADEVSVIIANWEAYGYYGGSLADLGQTPDDVDLKTYKAFRHVNHIVDLRTALEAILDNDSYVDSGNTPYTLASLMTEAEGRTSYNRSIAQLQALGYFDGEDLEEILKCVDLLSSQAGVSRFYIGDVEGGGEGYTLKYTSVIAQPVTPWSLFSITHRIIDSAEPPGGTWICKLTTSPNLNLIWASSLGDTDTIINPPGYPVLRVLAGASDRLIDNMPGVVDFSFEQANYNQKFQTIQFQINPFAPKIITAQFVLNPGPNAEAPGTRDIMIWEWPDMFGVHPATFSWTDAAWKNKWAEFRYTFDVV
jgi:hypothetical protein